jgi:phosphoribosylformimino-5-aminoimidazole carboxamide ribotide isomerase
MIAINGWQESAAINIKDFIDKYVHKKIKYVTCTDISTDGMLSGPNNGLYKKILDTFSHLKLIASGGVSGSKDLQSLKKVGVDGVIIGKAIYENRISLAELTNI